MEDTCYRGVIAAQCSNVRCLNWRRICDGAYDCVDGVDEQFCIELELNECGADEYRCQNGLCIPRLFSFDQIYDCLDRSDEPYGTFTSDGVLIVSPPPNIRPECSRNPSIFCEDCSCFSSDMCGFYVDCGLKYDSNPFEMAVLNPIDVYEWLDAFQYQHSLPYWCWKQIFCAMNTQYTYMIDEIGERCTNIPLPIFRENVNVSLHMRSGQVHECPRRLFIYPNRLPDIPYPPNVVFKYDASKFSMFSVVLPRFVCYNGTWCDEENEEICLTLDQIGWTRTNNIKFSTFYQHVKRYLYQKCHPLNFTRELSPNVYQCVSSNRSISRYRVQDGSKDCVFGDDESFGFQHVCSWNLTDRMRCQTGCLPRRHVLARQKGEVCSFKEIAYIATYTMFKSERSFGQNWLRRGSASFSDENLSKIFLFRQICDGVVHESNGDDERNCQMWRSTCNRFYQNCNGYWDCSDGSDEVTCQGGGLLEYSNAEQYCFQRTGLIWIDVSQVGDGHIDCLGATDERDNYCLVRYPHEPSRRWRCENASECVLVEEVCDGYPQCPNGDDEWPCPWRQHLNGRSDCAIGKFACANEEKCRVQGRARCQNTRNRAVCAEKEDSWFCDLVDEAHSYRPVETTTFNEFPIHNRSYSIIRTIHTSTSKITPRKQKVSGAERRTSI